MSNQHTVTFKNPWNKGKLIGQKPPLKLHEIWSIRIRLEMANGIRDLSLFNLAIDSKLRSCDLVKLRVNDIGHGSHILKRAMVMQQKTQSPVQFEITQKTRTALTSTVLRVGPSTACAERQSRVVQGFSVNLPVRRIGRSRLLHISSS